MAQRPIWRGHLRLALVSCPVALFSTVHDRSSIKFNLINPETGSRIRMLTVDGQTEKEVERRILPVLEEIRAARAAVEKSADRATTLNEKQVDELARRLAQSCAAWSGRLVLAANRKSVGLMLAAVLGAVLAGGVASWLAFGMPIHPVCVDITGGGRICGE